MRILYDHQIFTEQNFGGISRYYYELMQALPDLAQLSVVHSNNEYIRADPALSVRVSSKPETRRFYGVIERAVPWMFRRHWTAEAVNRAHSVHLLAGGGYDLFHPTYYDPYFLPHLGNRPFVLTVHDMIHELYPEFFPKDRTTQNKRELVSRATHLIAISENTKRDLIELLGVDEARISVVYHGSSLAAVGEQAGGKLPGRFLLMVGARTVYKNCYFTLLALRDLILSKPDLHVIFAGGGKFTADERRFFAGLGLEGRVHDFAADDAQLRFLYSHAEALIYPSLYEGFGIPVLEAFGCGCPLLSSNTPALREVAGEAAVYFEPKSARSIREAVESLLKDRERSEVLRANGARRLGDFSWKKCAEQTTAIYEKVLGGHAGR